MKSSRSEPRDRLSELPDSLILSIFEFLPMKYVVRSQILSHRWQKIWNITPYLQFDNETENYDENDEFRNFVNRCILCRRGARVYKFRASDCDYKDSIFSDMNLWVRFAVDNGVEELDLSFRGIYSGDEDCCVPHCLYSCSSLRKLSLEGMNMWGNLGGNMEWNKLKSLTIDMFVIYGDVINQILLGSPLLEVFNLSLYEMYPDSNLCFRSSSLRELSICKNYVSDSVSLVTDSKLEIWTPKLETLTISGMPYGKCLLMNVSSLTRLNLWFDGLDVAEYEHLSANTLLREILCQIIPAIQHVEGLALSQWCIQVLGVMKNNCGLLPFSNVKLLVLSGSFKEHEHIVDLLESFPKVKTLVVKEDDQTDGKSKLELKVKPNPPKSFLEELRTVKVTCIKHDFPIFPFIKSLLKYASKLEKMMFRLKGTTLLPRPSSDSLFKASQQLLRMPRSSPNAEFIFYD